MGNLIGIDRESKNGEGLPYESLYRLYVSVELYDKLIFYTTFVWELDWYR